MCCNNTYCHLSVLLIHRSSIVVVTVETDCVNNKTMMYVCADMWCCIRTHKEDVYQVCMHACLYWTDLFCTVSVL